MKWGVDGRGMQSVYRPTSPSTYKQGYTLLVCLTSVCRGSKTLILKNFFAHLSGIPPNPSDIFGEIIE